MSNDFHTNGELQQRKMDEIATRASESPRFRRSLMSNPGLIANRFQLDEENKAVLNDFCSKKF
jgi:hypothetical protein